MPITLEQAKRLKYGDIIYSNCESNSDNSPKRFKVNGSVKTWKTNPDRIKIPLKHGLYTYAEATNGSFEGNRLTYNLDEFELNEKAAFYKLLESKGFDPEAHHEAIQLNNEDRIALTHPSNWMNEKEAEYYLN